MRMSQPGFLLASGVGAGLWAGLAIGAGWLLQDAVQAAIAALEQHAARASMMLLLLLGIWLGCKLWQKYRFRKFCAVTHVKPAE